MKKILWVLLFAASFSSAQADGGSTFLQRAIAGKQRSAEHKARDQYRHPQQTLEFFDVKDTMTVVEIWPGEGWYTEILAPYLKDKGKLMPRIFQPMQSCLILKRVWKILLKKCTNNPRYMAKLN